jgi:TetR/AcrR family tetracycline transcriptional repressor
MALTRALITDAALAILTEFGLGDLSMRRLARDLGVQPSALYWHVKNKQDVFVLLAERMSAQVDSLQGGSRQGGPNTETQTGIAEALAALRTVLLRYRDGAEIFTVAYAQAGTEVLPGTLTAAAAAADRTGEVDAWIGYVLGLTAIEQNRDLLARLDTGPGSAARAAARNSSPLGMPSAEAVFTTGLQRLVGTASEA